VDSYIQSRVDRVAVDDRNDSHAGDRIAMMYTHDADDGVDVGRARSEERASLGVSSIRPSHR
jgi:hypothetical protein